MRLYNHRMNRGSTAERCAAHRASAPEAKSAARDRNGSEGAAQRATSLEDVSLKSLAPASAMDSAALRAKLQHAHNGDSASMHPVREQMQGAAGWCHLFSQCPSMLPTAAQTQKFHIATTHIIMVLSLRYGRPDFMLACFSNERRTVSVGKLPEAEGLPVYIV